MNQTKPNNELIPGFLYQIKYLNRWPIYNPNTNQSSNTDIDISPNDILLFIKKFIKKEELTEMQAWLFLTKNLVTVVAYSYFDAIRCNYIKKYEPNQTK